MVLCGIVLCCFLFVCGALVKFQRQECCGFVQTLSQYFDVIWLVCFHFPLFWFCVAFDHLNNICFSKKKKKKMKMKCTMIQLQLINHEVSCRLVEKLKIEIEEFFKLPIEEKNKFGQQNGDVEGYGNSLLNWGDRLYFITSPPHMRKPHIFSNLPPSFRFSLSVSLTLDNICLFEFMNL